MENPENADSALKVFHVSQMNKNPRLYKYYWRVFEKKDLPDDFQIVEFMSFPVGPSNIPMSSCVSVVNKEQDRNLRTYIVENFEPISLNKALECMVEFETNGQQYVAIVTELPRIGSPFNQKHEKWKDRKFAPAFDDDNDPVVDGFK